MVVLKSKRFLHRSILCILCIFLVDSATIEDTIAVRDLILKNYSANILPIANQSELLTINVTVYLRSIINLDEPTGELTTSLGIDLYWTDVSLKWNEFEHGDLGDIEFESSQIWTPILLLSNPGHLEQKWYGTDVVTVYNNGDVLQPRGAVFNSVCDVDVTYYPFDIQTCHIMLHAINSRVKFNAVHNNIDLSIFLESGVWSLQKTEVSTGNKTSKRGENTYCTMITIVLERRSLFNVLHFLVPILILVLLNSVVFLLPPESGERIGFSVTILLSITVYMTIISSKLPEASHPISALSFILIIYILQSALICIETVAILRFCNNRASRPMDSRMVRFLMSMPCILRKYKVINSTTNDTKLYSTEEKDVTQSQQQSNENQMHIDNVSSDVNSSVAWDKVASWLDILFLWLNIFISCVIAISYFVFISTRPKL